MSSGRDGMRSASGQSTDFSAVSYKSDIARMNELSERLDNEHNESILATFGSLSDTAAENLGRLLSLRTEISTTSSLARFHMAARFQESSYRKIGFGQCGIVLEIPGTPTVTKIATCQAMEDAIWNDYQVHTKIVEAWALFPTEVRVPRVHYFRAKDSTWWIEPVNREKLREALPASLKLPSAALVTERILPIPKVGREWIIDLFCPPEHRVNAKASPTNRDCLLRIYLGKRQAAGAPLSANFTLRNFNLHLDQMLRLNLPVRYFAQSMAETLAVIHWSAQVDAFDIEFVLGSEPAHQYADDCRPLTSKEVDDLGPCTTTEDRAKVNFQKRIARMWVLDFNLCSRIPEVMMRKYPDDVIGQYVWSFFENDPYYPLPLMEQSLDQDLWNDFTIAYLTKAEQILKGADKELMKLPEKFINECVERERSNLAQGLGHGYRVAKG